ncbi:DUF2000 domain-containing protein [Actinacidiphila guanduensis]|uniref:DUF2000 domain-containing protein n=1 Tax=Actinacidiphila guanduensis TaxID=310781 RepID=A0A1H0QR82_9ACTN|nr:DUF2000 domain-containing protein [Actinacidiphila guanduensis]SDP19772.1 Protein of unknown function [Actinacidiphila guanduensis]
MHALNRTGPAVGFAPDEVDLGMSARAARLKWVVVVDEALPPGRAANAAICAAAPTATQVPGLLGVDVADADGTVHPALPWVGCTVLAADAGTLRAIRAKAAAAPDTYVADMPAAAQRTLVFTDYQAAVGKTAAEDMDYCAVSIVGPRNRVSKLVGKLPLMP